MKIYTLLTRQQLRSCRLIETPWRSCDGNVTIWHYAELVFQQNSTRWVRFFFCSGYISPWWIFGSLHPYYSVFFRKHLGNHMCDCLSAKRITLGESHKPSTFQSRGMIETHQTSSISHSKFQHLNVSRLVLQLSLPNPLRCYVKNGDVVGTAPTLLHYILVTSDFIVSYTRVSETSAGCLRSIYPNLGMRQLFGDVTMGEWRHNQPTQLSDVPISVNRDLCTYQHTQQRIPDT